MQGLQKILLVLLSTYVLFIIVHFGFFHNDVHSPAAAGGTSTLSETNPR